MAALDRRQFVLMGAILPLGLAGCSAAQDAQDVQGTQAVEKPQEDASKSEAGAAVDYADEASWYLIPAITKDVDTFFVYPTQYMGFEESDPDYAPLDAPDMVAGVAGVYAKQASVFEEPTNLFIPWYRQASMRIEVAASKETGDIESVLATTPLTDLTAALDYYFTHYNGGRPFIIAGHSQGSACVRMLLKTYFKDHPDYYKRMVAAYAIGFSITQDDLDANPHMKFATGETDAGVVVSWNTEGPKNVEEGAYNIAVLAGGISINPLNWKLDDTYASAEENLSSRMPTNEEQTEFEIADIGADAQVNLERGVVVTNTSADPIVMSEYFGPQSFHNGDYTFFYRNIQDNVAKRINTYLTGEADQND